MTLYRRKSDLIFTEMDGDLVMMSMEQDAYFGLSGSGTKIWELLENAVSIDDIVDVLVKEFEVDEAICRRDVEGFLAQLEAQNLVYKN